jgi:hypothetical protein
MAKERRNADEVTALDISYSSDVSALAEEVARTNRPTALRRGDEEIARVVPSGKTLKPKKIDPEKLRVAFERLGKAMGDVDPDELIADIYRAREEGSRPTNRP